MEIQTLIVDKGRQGLRLDVFISDELDITRSHVRILAEQGNVIIKDGNVKMGRTVKEGDEITVTIPDPVELSLEPENIPLDIVYEDEYLAVINKQRGLVVHPAKGNESGTLVNALLFRLNNLSGINGVIRPGIVHRLDKDTTGLLVVAKTDEAHISLSKQIAEKTCKRTYVALLEGVLSKDEGTIDVPIGRCKSDRKKMAVVRDVADGRYAVTDYTVLKRYQKYTLTEFRLHTGRTHQIRVHAKHIGHPVVGDLLYNGNVNKLNAPSHMLHARKIEFVHPQTQKKLSFEVAPPLDFSKIIDKLEKNS